MSGSGDEFGADVATLQQVSQVVAGDYLHEYRGVLVETNERVYILSLAPDLVDIDAAVDAFGKVSDQWFNASANANIRPIRERNSDPRPWIALPVNRDGTLTTVQPDLSPEATETLVTETAEGLRTLGLYNTVHGYLSPDDIYLPNSAEETPEITVEIGGFGLEAALQAALGEFELTAYTAPELVDGTNQPTEQTDVYGLGAITYFALTGQPPVSGADLEGAIRDGPTNPPSTYVPEIPPDVDEVVLQALSTNPADRYESPYAFHRAFLSVFDPTAFGTHGERSDDRAPSVDDTDTPGTAPTDPDDGHTTDTTQSTSDTGDTDASAEPTTSSGSDSSILTTRRSAVGLIGAVGIGGGVAALIQGDTNEESTSEPADPSETATPAPADETPTVDRSDGEQAEPLEGVGLTSGSIYLTGQTVFITGLNANSGYIIRRLNQYDETESLQRALQSSENGTVEFTFESTASGDFVIVDQDGNYVGLEDGAAEPAVNPTRENARAVAFSVVSEGLSAEFGTETVDNDGSGTTVEYVINSPIRDTYTVTIDAEGLVSDPLETIFRDDADVSDSVDDRIQITQRGSNTAEGTYYLDFDGIAADTYTFEATMDQVETSATDDIIVRNVTERTVEFPISFLSVQVGDVAKIPLDLIGTDVATLQIGDLEESGYAITTEVTDNDGAAVVDFDTYVAANGTPSDALSPGNDSTSLSNITRLDGSYDGNQPAGSDLLNAFDYSLFAASGRVPGPIQRQADSRATLDLNEQ